jgi:signal-transduction protein with cAMP-binding, CBS, and nucleotidyltransferase domain
MSNTLDQSISNFVDITLVIQNSDQIISDAVKKMESHGVDSLLVRDKNEIKGIVTYKDILFGVVSKGKDPTKTRLIDIMRTPLVVIQKDAKIKDAIMLMGKNNVRRLVVFDNKIPIGVISQKTLVGNIAKQAIALPELEIPNKIKCPYCSSIFDNKETLSSHIDDIHVGRGLFEGNLSRVNELGSVNPPYDFPKTI